MQSLRDKIDEIRVLLDERKSPIFVVAETWLDGSHSSNEVEIKGYNLTRLDRSCNPNRGGVAIYAKNNVNTSLITMKSHPKPCKCENLWMKITFGAKRTMILGAIYRSHLNDNFVEHIRLDLEDLVSLKHPILLIGDFNYDLMKDGRIVEEYRRTMESYLLDQQIRKPTRVTESTSTLIDHAWITNEELVVDSDTAGIK